MNANLKPCPFCGGRAEEFGRRALIGPVSDDEAVRVVHCTTCYNGSDEYKTPSEAVAAWNRRVSPAAPDVAALAARLTELAAEIADALEGVTPGEWKCWNGFQVVGEGPPMMAMTRIGPDPYGGVMSDRYGGNGLDLYASREDAEFVASAPELMVRALDGLRECAALLAAPEPSNEAVVERDRLWCRVILATLDTRDVERVTRKFNEVRPDPDVLVRLAADPKEAQDG